MQFSLRNYIFFKLITYVMEVTCHFQGLKQRLFLLAVTMLSYKPLNVIYIMENGKGIASDRIG